MFYLKSNSTEEWGKGCETGKEGRSIQGRVISLATTADNFCSVSWAFLRSLVNQLNKGFQEEHKGLCIH
jgi:hypothetical protein